MSETPPPRDPHDPPDPGEPVEDETVVVPPAEPVEEAVVVDEWGPESETFVEQTEVEEVPPKKPPVLWPWLLALLLLVLGGLGAYLLFAGDDDEPAATTSAQTTTAPTTTDEEAELVTVPDVVGTTSSQATETLVAAGLSVNLEAVPSDAPPGQVVAQSPTAGEQVERASTVRINVAEERPAPTPTTTDGETTEAGTTTGATTPTPTPTPEPATVPDVVGDSLADAAREFADQQLRASVQYVPSTEAQGEVVAQARPGGTRVRRGSNVQVNVSVGAQPAENVQVPDVGGQTVAEARTALEQAGLEVLALNLDGDVRNESLVASQSPGAGVAIPRGSLVLLYVGS
jgi:serine/threonine-protein kinase